MSGWSQTEIKTEIESEIEEEFCAVVESIKSEEERNADIKPATLPDCYQLQTVETRSECSQSNDDVCSSLCCRLCAIPNNDMVEIFSSLEMTKCILERIEYALPITVKETDALPKQICRLCLEELERCYRFRKTVAVAEKRLLVFNKLASMKSEEDERNNNPFPLHNAQQAATESDNVGGLSETNSDMNMNNNKFTITHEDAPNLKSCLVVLSSFQTRSEKNSDAKNGGKSSSNTEDLNTDGKIVSENHQASTCDREVNMENPDDFAQSQSREQLHKCNICAKTFQQKYYLTRHSLIHTDERSHKCNVCAKTFKQKHHLTEHSRIHADERPHKCNVCAKTFKQKSHLTEHSLIHADERPHKCNVCAKTFTRKYYLIEHSLIHADERPHKCNVCAKTFTRKYHLTEHSRIHADERPHKCNVCAKTFKQKHYLTQHSLIHADERPHKCNVCAKTFIKKSNLTKHSRIHADEEPHKCNVCEKTFKQKRHLTQHSRIHTDERPHTCSVCAKTFIKKSNLTKHSRIHADEIPHKCNVCEKMFKQKHHLTGHSESHKERTSQP